MQDFVLGVSNLQRGGGGLDLLIIPDYLLFYYFSPIFLKFLQDNEIILS